MFLCRGAARLCAADPAAFKSPALLQVHVRASCRLRDAARARRDNNNNNNNNNGGGCASQRYGALCGVEHRCSSSSSPRFITVQHRGLSGLSGPSAAVALENLSRSQSGGDALARTLLLGTRRRDRPETRGGGVLFTRGLQQPTITQTRASSTAPAPQKRDADAGETSTEEDQKREMQNLKEPSIPSSSSTSSSSVPKAPGEAEPDDGKPNKTQQLKKVFKEYGAVGVSFHVTISLMSLGMFYLLVSSGIDMAAVLCKLGFSEAVVQSKMAAGTSTFVLAYAVHKLFAPVRMSITLVSVPLIVRYFRKTGLFRPPAP